MTTVFDRHYDIAVIGGGFTGMAFAALAAQQGYKIVCLERGPASRESEGLRTTTITAGSRDILIRAGIWHHLDTRRICPVARVEVYEAGQAARVNLAADDDAGENPLGWVVLNDDLHAAMRAASDACITMHDCAVAGFDTGAGDVANHLHGGHTLRARLVVGADGRESFVRDFMGVRVRRWRYDQAAIITCIRHDAPHEHAALEIFREDGPLAVLPMADDDRIRRSAVVITERMFGAFSPHKSKLMKLSDDDFAALLLRHLPVHYAPAEIIGPRRIWPLSYHHAHDYIAPRMALIGDAAHGLHPAAAQGLNLGLRDAAALADMLGADPGDADILAAYQRARRPDAVLTAAATHSLIQIFENRLPPVHAARGAALEFLAGSSALAKKISSALTARASGR